MVIGPTRRARRRKFHRAVVTGIAALLMFPAQGAIAADTYRATSSTAQSGPADADAAIPSFDLIDLRNGKPVDLAGLRTPGRAMLVWLWAA